MAVILTGGPFIASTQDVDGTHYVSSVSQPDSSKPSLLFGFHHERRFAVRLNAEQANAFRAEMRKAGKIAILETP